MAALSRPQIGIGLKGNSAAKPNRILISTTRPNDLPNGSDARIRVSTGGVGDAD